MMTRDVIERPNWNVAATSTIAGGAYSGGDNGFWDTLPSATADAVSGLPAGVVSEWSRSGGVGHRLAVAQSAAGTILGQLADSVELVADFDVLPAAVQSAVLSELSLGSTAIAPVASSADVAKFSASEEGKALVAEWRGHAARRLGIVKTRIKRVLGQLAEGEQAALWGWFENLDVVESEAIIRQLAR